MVDLGARLLGLRLGLRLVVCLVALVIQVRGAASVQHVFVGEPDLEEGVNEADRNGVELGNAEHLLRKLADARTDETSLRSLAQAEIPPRKTDSSFVGDTQ